MTAVVARLCQPPITLAPLVGDEQLRGGSWSFSAPGSGSTARTTTTTYDMTFLAFPIQLTNPLNQSSYADYDYRMGTLIRVTGPNTTSTPTDCSLASYPIPANEESTCAQYDVFGRLIKLVKPGDSTSLPTVQASYYDSDQPFRYRIDRRETAGSATARVEKQFYDGLGRKIQLKAESIAELRLRPPRPPDPRLDDWQCDGSLRRDLQLQHARQPGQQGRRSVYLSSQHR